MNTVPKQRKKPRQCRGFLRLCGRAFPPDNAPALPSRPCPGACCGRKRPSQGSSPPHRERRSAARSNSRRPGHVAARVRTALEHAGLRVDPDGARMAHGIGIVLHPAHGVPAPGQLVGHVSGDAAFQLRSLLALPQVRPQPTGRVDGFRRSCRNPARGWRWRPLRLGLALAAHGAVDQERDLPSLSSMAGFRVWKGALAGLEAIDIVRGRGEEAAPVLEQPCPGARCREPEIMVDAFWIEQRLTVHHAKPDGIAHGIRGGARLPGGPVHADAGGLPLAVPAEQALQQDVPRRPGRKGRYRGREGLLSGLDDEVVIVRAAFLYPRQVRNC